MKSVERFAIIDNKGIIFEDGSEDYLRDIFYAEKHDFEFEGDLLFVKILARTR